ncbi:hypothetical protein [Paenarthrobacter sp. AB444]|uniref:hypothetical protein n=1 Tax=Paenarthrobacter sp. AB444 TaxID=3025681 RepID=UPI0023666142|nr:hypothetical protein [Paenarthrobacter sp. AB444]MDD7833896.1 hypothetical protein [Paenarthrobacter sp. AB444]
MGMYAFGPWTVDLRGDELADIRHRGLPVLRGLRAVVRNRNWLTLTPSVVSCRVEETGDSLRLGLDVEWEGYTDRYAGRVSVVLDGLGVSVVFEGTAMAEFASNRIGLVVLHRPDDAGRAVTVTSPAGVLTESAFPEHISAHQPFVDIAALSWERDGVAYQLNFEGDVFETEDQRNWTDASFKTYSTPLSRPFPVMHREGDTVSQSLRLSARQAVRVGSEAVGVVPELGISGVGSLLAELASDPMPGPCALPGIGSLLAELALDPVPGSGCVSVEAAVELASRLGLPLDARIVASSPAEAVAVLRSLPLDRVVRLGVYSAASHVTEAELWDAVAVEAKELTYDGELLAGARGHFTELNRNPGSAVPEAGGVTYSITPQMHAVEREAVIETLAMQSLTAREAGRIAGSRPLHLGPVTLAPRFNAVATEAPLAEELPSRDPLRETPFAAAWLLGSVAALTVPGVASVSYGVELGAPAGELLLQLASLRGREVLTCTEPGTVAAYPIRTADGLLVFAANLTGFASAIRFIGPSGEYRDVELAPWQTTTVLLP